MYTKDIITVDVIGIYYFSNALGLEIIESTDF